MIPSSRAWQQYLDYCANNYITLNAYFYRYEADEGTERTRFAITASFWDGYEHVTDEIGYHFWDWCNTHQKLDVEKFELPKAWIHDIFANTHADLQRRLRNNESDWTNFIENCESSNIWIEP